MAGSKPLRKIQLGREATAGTAVAATSVWRGIGTLEDRQEPIFAEEDIGILPGTDRSYTPFLDAGIEFEPVPATFEQLPHIGEAGIKTIGTGAADGVGSGKVYDYTFPETAKPTIKTYTIEGGDDEGAEEMEYSFVTDFTLEGEAKDVWKMSANWQGRQISVSTFTPALTVPSVEEMLFGKTKLYIDAIGGAYGTTLKSSTLIKASAKYTTGFIPVWLGDNLYFTLHKMTVPALELVITFEHDGTSIAEKANWRNRTPRLISLKCEGSALTTPGTLYSFRTMILNVAGKWSKFGKIGEKDGNDIVEGTFIGRYNTTKADFGELIVVNEVSTIP